VLFKLDETDAGRESKEESRVSRFLGSEVQGYVGFLVPRSWFLVLGVSGTERSTSGL
jgi:hypothetical protein